jgi:beta-glucosidase
MLRNFRQTIPGCSSLLTWLAAVAASLLLATRAYASDPQVERQVDQLLSQLTPEEKIELLGGVHNFYTKDIPRIHLPGFKMTDGPVGTRNDGPSTAYPAGVLLASTWDPAVAEQEGKALGQDARARGDNFVLGPGVNIYRVPQNGRNFEYFGEDPFLAAAIAPAYIIGVQSQGVAACVKHYDANNQETLRESINVIVDERTLEEIYLPAFEGAVKVGHVRSVMASYNLINGFHATENHYLLTDVLRTQWNFDGILMSDWNATHDTLGPTNAGMDLEMPSGKYLNEKTLAPLLDSKQVKQATIDEKVRRLLRVAIEMNWLNRPQLDPTVPKDNPQSDAAALAVAREGIVLLKNTGNLLPLDRSKIHSIVLLGPGADRYVAGGGSSYTKPTRPVTILAGLTSLAPDVKITTVPYSDWRSSRLDALAKASKFESDHLTATFYNSVDLTGDAALTRTDSDIDFNWRTKLPAPQITSGNFSIRWTGAIKPDHSGPGTFITRSDDGSRVLLDGKLIVDNWHAQQAHTEAGTVTLQANHVYQLAVEYYNAGGEASMQFAYVAASQEMTPAEQSTLASADAAIVCVHADESEGSDRPYDLVGTQEQLTHDTQAVNPRTIVILEAGGNVGMKDWIDNVPALIDAWYPGQAGGKAIAEILFGDTNPSGHLPDTFEKDWPDSPAYGHYPGDGKKVEYAEGIYVGYRWYDKKQIQPRFPFGYGLSYTTFDLKNLKPTTQDGQPGYTIDVTNTGTRAGATVAQLYIRPKGPQPIDRPTQELKGFARVVLQPGETKTVSFPLNARSFSYWDVTTHNWKSVPGVYEIAVGLCSRDTAQTTTIDWK